jgi:OmpA-OmpF porin, OOP family
MKHVLYFLIALLCISISFQFFTGNTFAQDVQSNQKNLKVYSKFDFIPGDEVIFEDNQESEKNGEFPSRWDLTKGTIENAFFDNSNVIYFFKCNVNNAGGIVPLIKNNKEDYLPEEFTVEFDAYFENIHSSYTLYFADFKNQINLDKDYKNEDKWIRFKNYNFDGNSIEPAWLEGYTNENYTKTFYPGWRRISISFNKRVLKTYIDETRLLNIPNLGYNPTGITIGYHTPSGKTKGYIKNIRIAKGAIPLYDKVITDGKFTTTGIKFDINKATLKPESMGVINDIFNLMNQYPGLNFSVEGHTDADGSDDSNMKLSEARANTVLNQLVSMGIESKRLKAKGFGESKPVSENNSAEGKANNRRVEFVKF